ncbi:uncharacterized protein EV154DRAFT_514238 [Mucor mucedo]|uniref:uncharacterized protein n=1 Tax=Mucor mucedo TaxID=29922 RepID=UPI00221F621F|nr:uncharacterized protein EV154DRAFT_514238 [Mucor mucedo]KAI7889589.1 hypothetical protein EV154DRAFT_514238 [Mucor mucedo]
MGSNYSNLKHQLSPKKVPKHLRPTKKKAAHKQKSTHKEAPAQAVKKAFVKVTVQNEDNITTEEETVLVGTGPRGAFRWFKGRRYLNYVTEDGSIGTGILPNDQLELDRIRVLSFIIRWAFKGTVLAPVERKLKSGIQVLSVGYGPGIWSGHHIMDMAIDFPQSQFTVIDVADLLPADFEEITTDEKDVFGHKNNSSLFTPIHPNLPKKFQETNSRLESDLSLDSNSSFSNVLLSRVDDTYDSDCTQEVMDDDLSPPKHRKLLRNLDFYQTNVVDGGLPFPDDQFDFVKQRLVTASFTLADWKRVIEELVRVTKPGGYIQLLEIDYNTFNLGPNGKAWELQLLQTAREKRNMEPRMALYLPDMLKSAGLIDVSSKLVSIPLGSWGLDLGSLWKHNMEMFADSSSPLLSKLVGISESEYRRRWRDMFEEVKDKKAFSNIHAAWGQKPLKK